MAIAHQHVFREPSDIGIMVCSVCHLMLPQNAWEAILRSDCLKNTHQWVWQQNKVRYYCRQCKQDVNWAELDGSFGNTPNAIIGTQCPAYKIPNEWKWNSSLVGKWDVKTVVDANGVPDFVLTEKPTVHDLNSYKTMQQQAFVYGQYGPAMMGKPETITGDILTYESGSAQWKEAEKKADKLIDEFVEHYDRSAEEDRPKPKLAWEV